MSGITSLFRDDAYSGSERKHYDWLRKYYFPETDFIVYPNVALGVIIDPDSAEDLRPRVAFSIGRDELRSKIFSSFGLPLLHLRNYEGIGN